MPLLPGRAQYRVMNTATTDSVPVDSAALETVAYDPETRLLTLTFHSGGVYEYVNVAQTVWEELLRAESKGQFFHDSIRDHYAYRKVGA